METALFNAFKGAKESKEKINALSLMFLEQTVIIYVFDAAPFNMNFHSF